MFHEANKSDYFVGTEHARFCAPGLLQELHFSLSTTGSEYCTYGLLCSAMIFRL